MCDSLEGGFLFDLEMCVQEAFWIIRHHHLLITQVKEFVMSTVKTCCSTSNENVALPCRRAKVARASCKDAIVRICRITLQPVPIQFVHPAAPGRCHQPSWMYQLMKLMLTRAQQSPLKSKTSLYVSAPALDDRLNSHKLAPPRGITARMQK